MSARQPFETTSLPPEPHAIAPDGSDVRVLLRQAGGSMAHFSLAPGKTSGAVTHRTVDETWYILDGAGQMWRKQDDREEVVELREGVCLTIPLGTHFQFRATGDAPLMILGVTMPPWPNTDDEAIPVDGPWEPAAS